MSSILAGADSANIGLAGALRQHAGLRPARTAFRILDHDLNEAETITYQDLGDRAERVATDLVWRNVAGRPITLLQGISLSLGVINCGGSAGPLNPQLLTRRADELKNDLAEAAPVAFIAWRMSGASLHRMGSPL